MKRAGYLLLAGTLISGAAAWASAAADRPGATIHRDAPRTERLALIRTAAPY